MVSVRRGRHEEAKQQARKTGQRSAKVWDKITRPQGLKGFKPDGFVKSPSVPLGAGLRFMRSLRGEAPGPHSSVFARLVPPAAGELFTNLSCG